MPRNLADHSHSSAQSGLQITLDALRDCFGPYSTQMSGDSYLCLASSAPLPRPALAPHPQPGATRVRPPATSHQSACLYGAGWQSIPLDCQRHCTHCGLLRTGMLIENPVLLYRLSEHRQIAVHYLPACGYRHLHKVDPRQKNAGAILWSAQMYACRHRI